MFEEVKMDRFGKVHRLRRIQPIVLRNVQGTVCHGSGQPLPQQTLSSSTFAIFACKSVCGNMVMVVDVNEECWVGRHANYAYFLGIPMLLLYVLGFPMIAMVMVQRLQSAVRETRKSIAAAVAAAAVPDTNSGKQSSSKGKHHRWFSNAHVVENITSAQMSTHEAFGMLYTSFREEVWWWEITVTLRKIVVVGIGVFGENMGEMQVHVTLLCIGKFEKYIISSYFLFVFVCTCTLIIIFFPFLLSFFLNTYMYIQSLFCCARPSYNRMEKKNCSIT